MNKWYSDPAPSIGHYVSSRIRLSRNWEDYSFPSMLSVTEASELVGRLTYTFDDVESIDGLKHKVMTMDKLSDTEKLALKERRAINGGAAASRRPSGLILSEDESVSILLNGDDHIRMQFLAPGMNLERLWTVADRLDDYVNSKIEYAFDDKYGYLTAFPTNVGTGMRANAVMHLPALSQSKQFDALISGFSRFGVTIKGVHGNGRENWGDLYDISNANTLGISEAGIIEQVRKIGEQLNAQEDKARVESLNSGRISREDEAYKSYGVLRYARKISLKDALIYLSHLKAGIEDGLIIPDKPVSIYSIMLEIQPYNLRNRADKPLDDEELDIMRAGFIRKKLPDIREV